MRLRQRLMLRRIRRAKIEKFSRIYMAITRKLLQMGFKVKTNPALGMIECHTAHTGLFVGSEKIGPGIVGFLHSCNACLGFEECHKYFKTNGKLPTEKDNLFVRCRNETMHKDGLYKPVILYPSATKPKSSPFVIANIVTDLRTLIKTHVLGVGKKKK